MDITVSVSVSMPEGWPATNAPLRLTTASSSPVAEAHSMGGFGLPDYAWLAAFHILGRQQEDLGNRACAAGNRMSGIGSGVEIKQFPNTARARAPGSLGNGKDCAWASIEPSASLATMIVACSAGATSGACVGAESSLGEQSLVRTIAQLP